MIVRTKSRSYGRAETDSDHKLVKMNMHIEWTKLEKHQKPADCIDLHGFTDKEKQKWEDCHYRKGTN